MIKAFLKALPGAQWFRPGWPDEARYIVQLIALRRAMKGYRFEGNCLNAGSGEGLYARFLDQLPEVKHITHMDLTRPEIAAQFANGRHTDVAGSVTEMPFEPGAFQACLCTEVMEHVTDDAKGFSELARVVRAGGLVLITTPTPPAPFDPAHVREGYTLAEMRGQLEQHGLEVLSHTFCFHSIMRALLVMWHWQFERLGKGQHSVMPRFAILTLALLDRSLRLGKPWDLVVLARRLPSP